MQYEILAASAEAGSTDFSSDGADELLEKKVNEYIAKGWRPQGGVSCALRKRDPEGIYNVDMVWCFQAMIKED